jgi:hypothetical protein
MSMYDKVVKEKALSQVEIMYALYVVRNESL